MKIRKVIWKSKWCTCKIRLVRDYKGWHHFQYKKVGGPAWLELNTGANLVWWPVAAIEEALGKELS